MDCSEGYRFRALDSGKYEIRFQNVLHDESVAAMELEHDDIVFGAFDDDHLGDMWNLIPNDDCFGYYLQHSGNNNLFMGVTNLEDGIVPGGEEYGEDNIGFRVIVQAGQDQEWESNSLAAGFSLQGCNLVSVFGQHLSSSVAVPLGGGRGSGRSGRYYRRGHAKRKGGKILALTLI